jgi:hypothetical protein
MLGLMMIIMTMMKSEVIGGSIIIGRVRNNCGGSFGEMAHMLLEELRLHLPNERPDRSTPK